MKIVCIALGALLFLLSFFFPEGIGQLLIVSASASLLGMGLLMLTAAIDQRYLAYKFYMVFHVMQPVFLFLMAWLYPIQLEMAVVNTTLLEGRAYTLYYSFLTVPILGLILALALRAFGRRSGERGIDFYSGAAGRRLDFLLLISAMAVLSSWFILGVPGVLGYALRVFRAALAFTPFLAGLYFGRSALVRNVWVLVLALGIVFSLLTGSRGYAFWPLLMYVLGVLFQLKTPRIRFAGWALFLISLPLGIFLIGFIQQLRSEVGRKSIRETDIAEVASYIPKALQNTLSRGGEVYLEGEATGASTGFSRLVDWTLLFAPNMSPDPVGYRGYGDFHQELLSIFAFGGSDLRRTFGNFYPSVLYARNYGFNVYADVDERGMQASFTVPFSVMADSWSRFGLISSVSQVLFLLSFFVGVEAFIRRCFWSKPDIMVFLAFFLFDNALRFATVYTVIRSVRTVILYGTFTFCVVWGIRFIRKTFLPHILAPIENAPPAFAPRPIRYK